MQIKMDGSDILIHFLISAVGTVMCTIYLIIQTLKNRDKK